MLSRQIPKTDRSQYRIGSPLLLLFSTPFIVWQMGVLYFSGTAMSLLGGTPMPLDDTDTMLVIAAGYLASILAICLFPRKAVWMERVVLPTALAVTAAMLLPLPAWAVTALFYASVFCCVFSIGTMASVAAQHFTVDTTWRDGIISMAVGGVLIAILQNDMFEVSFAAFTVLSVLLIAAQTVFYYLIPARIEVAYAGPDRPAKLPKILFAGVWLISGFATLLICFASSYAESVPHGVSALYLSASVMSVALYLLRKRLLAGSIRVFGSFFAIAVFGFVLAFLSLRIPGLQIIACVLLGFIAVLAGLWIFFMASAFSVYPTRFVGAIGAGMGLLLAGLHSGLQEALRGDIPLLYGIYAALSVALLLVYFFMEPYFTRRWLAHEPPVSAPAASEKTSAPAPAASHPFAALSEQERILAGLILDGHTETSCAKAMNISLNTQKGYRKNLYFKLDIHSKRELFELAKNR